MHVQFVVCLALLSWPLEVEVAVAHYLMVRRSQPPPEAALYAACVCSLLPELTPLRSLLNGEWWDPLGFIIYTTDEFLRFL